jgi:hypothetical protein
MCLLFGFSACVAVYLNWLLCSGISESQAWLRLQMTMMETNSKKAKATQANKPTTKQHTRTTNQVFLLKLLSIDRLTVCVFSIYYSRFYPFIKFIKILLELLNLLNYSVLVTFGLIQLFFF